jgi:hypothetical protein
MVEITVEELLVRFGSLVVEETVAVLLASVEELKVLALTSKVTRASPPTLTVPSEQLMVVVAVV